MSYAIRKDGQGFRAVNGPDDVDFDEYYRETVPVLIPSLSASIGATVKAIDADADAIYAAALGNREAEYKQAEDEAIAYRTANYSGDVPPYVQAWSSAKRKTAQWAAEDILATALAWRTAQAAIRTNRLACKEAARSATTTEELAPVVAQWHAFVVSITAQLNTP